MDGIQRFRGVQNWALGGKGSKINYLRKFQIYVFKIVLKKSNRQSVMLNCPGDTFQNLDYPTNSFNQPSATLECSAAIALIKTDDNLF